MTTAVSIRRSWKRTESKIAALLGGVRVPVTGRQRGDVPDVRHEWLALEIKSRKELPEWLHEALAQAEACARSGQLPVAVLHEVGTPYRDALLVVKLSDWLTWFGGAKEAVE